MTDDGRPPRKSKGAAAEPVAPPVVLVVDVTAERPDLRAIILTGGDPGAIKNGSVAVEVRRKPIRWMTLRDRIVGLLHRSA